MNQEKLLSLLSKLARLTDEEIDHGAATILLVCRGKALELLGADAPPPPQRPIKIPDKPPKPPEAGALET